MASRSVLLGLRLRWMLNHQMGITQLQCSLKSSASDGHSIRSASISPFGKMVVSTSSVKQFSQTASVDTDLTPKEVFEKMKSDGSYIVDVREPHELVNDGRIQGSVNIPLGEVETALRLKDSEFKKKYGAEKPQADGDNVIFHCRGGVRSLKALQCARSLGYAKSKHLAGGYKAWQAEFGK